MATNYCNKTEMLSELKDWQQTKSRIAYERLGKKFLLIATNYLNNINFIRYSQDRKDEMVSDAVIIMLKYINDFDTTKTNPFAYFTKITYHSFLQTIKRSKRRSKMFVPLDIAEQSCDFTLLEIK